MQQKLEMKLNSSKKLELTDIGGPKAKINYRRNFGNRLKAGNWEVEIGINSGGKLESVGLFRRLGTYV